MLLDDLILIFLQKITQLVLPNIIINTQDLHTIWSSKSVELQCVSSSTYLTLPDAIRKATRLLLQHSYLSKAHHRNLLLFRM